VVRLTGDDQEREKNEPERTERGVIIEGTIKEDMGKFQRATCDSWGKQGKKVSGSKWP